MDEVEADNVDTEESLEEQRELKIGHLRCLHNNKSYEIALGDHSIGRDEERCGIVIDHESLSSIHAVLEACDRSSLTLHDNHSLNGTTCNGNKMTPGVRYDLEHNDAIKMGEVNFVFLFNNVESNDKDNIARTSVKSCIERKLGKEDSVSIFDKDTQKIDASNDEDDDLFDAQTQAVVSNDHKKNDNDNNDDDEDLFEAQTQALTDNDRVTNNDDLFEAQTQAVVGNGQSNLNAEPNSGDEDDPTIFDYPTQAIINTTNNTDKESRSSVSHQQEEEKAEDGADKKEDDHNEEEDEDDMFIMATQEVVRPDKKSVVKEKKNGNVVVAKEKESVDEENDQEERNEEDTALFECATQAVTPNIQADKYASEVVHDADEADVFECQTQAVFEDDNKDDESKDDKGNEVDREGTEEPNNDVVNETSSDNPGTDEAHSEKRGMNETYVVNEANVENSAVNETYIVNESNVDNKTANETFVIKTTNVVEETKLLDDDEEPTQMMTDTVLLADLNKDKSIDTQEPQGRNAAVVDDNKDLKSKDDHDDNTIGDKNEGQSVKTNHSSVAEADKSQSVTDEIDTIPMESFSTEKKDPDRERENEVTNDTEVLKADEVDLSEEVLKNGKKWEDATVKENQKGRSQRLLKRKGAKMKSDQPLPSPRKTLQQDKPSVSKSNSGSVKDQQTLDRRPRRRRHEETKSSGIKTTANTNDTDDTIQNTAAASPSKRERREAGVVQPSTSKASHEARKIEAPKPKKQTLVPKARSLRIHQTKSTNDKSKAVEDPKVDEIADVNIDSDPSASTKLELRTSNTSKRVENNFVMINDEGVYDDNNRGDSGLREAEDPRPPSLPSKTTKKTKKESVKAATAKAMVDNSTKTKSAVNMDSVESSSNDKTPSGLPLRRSSRPSKRPNFFNDFVSKVPPKVQRRKNDRENDVGNKVREQTTLKIQGGKVGKKTKSASTTNLRSSVKATRNTATRVTTTKTTMKSKKITRPKQSKSNKWVLPKLTRQRRTTANNTKTKKPSSEVTVVSEWSDVGVAFADKPSAQDKKLVESLGMSMSDDVLTCHLLVAESIDHESHVLLCAVARGVPIVNREWLKASNEAKEPQDPWAFILEDDKSEEGYSFSLIKALKQASKQPVLHGFRVFCSPSIKPGTDRLKELIEVSGGRLLSRLPSRLTRNTLIISCREDVNAMTSVVNDTAGAIHSTDLILRSVLTQSLDLENHLLKF